MKKTFAASIAAVLFVAGALAFAGGAKSWKQTKQSDFSGGKLKGVSARSTGDIVLSLAGGKGVRLREQFVWDMDIGADGATCIAVGSPAAAYRIRGGKVQLVLKTSEQHAYSIAVDRTGNVFLGTAPRGIIYKADPKGQVTIFADLPDNYIWDMAFDASGNLIAATGPNGVLYNLGADGKKPRIIFRSPRRNLMSLLVAADGTMFVGTQPDGLLYKIGRNGKPFVLMDSAEDDVHCLAMGPDGSVYAGTAAAPAGVAPRSMGQPMPSTSGRTMVPRMTSKSGPVMVPSASMRRSVSGRPTGAGAAASIYRIKPTGDISRLFVLGGASIYSIAVNKDFVFAGSGTKGRIYQIDKDGNYTIIADRREKQILSMAVGRDGSLVLATGVPGSVVPLQQTQVKTGEYESSVFDAGYIAGWGRLSWLAQTPKGTSVNLYVRAGNSRKVDNTWTNWVGPYKNAMGETVKLPVARFVQCKSVLATTDPRLSPVLKEFSLAYAWRNRAPAISSLIVNGRSAASRAPKAPTGSRMPVMRQPTMRMPSMTRPHQTLPARIKKINWAASDPDRDSLLLKLEFKGIDEKEWKTLAKRIVGKNEFVWDTNRMPDGHYLIRLTASDELSNAPADAAQDVEVSEPIIIDNRRPAIKGLKIVGKAKNGKVIISGIAEDNISYIKALRVSIDSNDWVPVFASDGILDSVKEEFTFKSPKLEKGEHVFVFNALDAFGNVGGDKIVVNITEPEPVKAAPKPAPPVVKPPKPKQPVPPKPDKKTAVKETKPAKPKDVKKPAAAKQPKAGEQKKKKPAKDTP